MFTFRANPDHDGAAGTHRLIPVIRTAATIGFAIAPCSLGFVIVAASEHLIRSIMVGADPEMLMSDLQNKFPTDVLEVDDHSNTGLVAEVLELLERSDRDLDLSLDLRGMAAHVVLAERIVKAGQS